MDDCGKHMILKLVNAGSFHHERKISFFSVKTEQYLKVIIRYVPLKFLLIHYNNTVQDISSYNPKDSHEIKPHF